MSYRHFFIGLLLLLTAFACTKRLSKSELADVLVDMYIYDQLFMRVHIYREQDSTSVYHSVFQKHNCTEKQFQVSIKHYGANPKDLKEVYTEVDEKIKLLKKEYGDVVDAIQKEKALQIKMDSLYRYPSDTMYRYIFHRCLLWEQEFTMDNIVPATDSTAIEPIVEEEFTKEAINEREDIPIPAGKKILERKHEQLNLQRVVEKEALKLESETVK